jgi:hypothetical protein
MSQRWLERIGFLLWLGLAVTIALALMGFLLAR